MGAEEPSMRVRLSATKALNNSLDFCDSNFEVDAERDAIMTVVCESTQHGDRDLQVGVAVVLTLHKSSPPPSMVLWHY